ncbi:MAG: hypothetical protein POH28_02790 [Acidocella sp.]|nr:hypothetical protein [Acidocella sp.]
MASASNPKGSNRASQIDIYVEKTVRIYAEFAGFLSENEEHGHVPFLNAAAEIFQEYFRGQPNFSSGTNIRKTVGRTERCLEKL